MPIKTLTAEFAAIRGFGAAALVVAAPILAGVAALMPQAARAAEDCDKLAHSKVPFEVSMKVGEAEIKYQVFRSDKHMTKLLIHQLDGNITKLENQGTFPKSMNLPNGESATFEYTVPTDTPLYEQKVKSLGMKLMHGKDVLLDAPATLEYLPDEPVKLAGCTFNTKHYVQITSKNGRESRNEIWYSPDLEFGLKSVSSLKAGDKQVTKQAQATGLTTSFTPFK